MDWLPNRFPKWCMTLFVLAFLGTPSARAQGGGDLEEAHRLQAEVVDNFSTGHYQLAIPLAERALAILERLEGSDDPDIGAALNNLALLYRRTGDFVKAEALYQRALAIFEKSRGPDHPDTAAALLNLSALYEATGAYAKAQPLAERALAILERARGPDHPDTAAALNSLAGIYSLTGGYSKAEPLYKRALAIREKTVGPEHLDTATSLNNLAELYRTIGLYREAEPLYQRALAIREKVLGPDHPDTAEALNNLALLYEQTGAPTRAIPLAERALAILQNAFGSESPDIASVLDNLAGIYVDAGAYGKAEPLYQRALAIREKELGPNHPDTAGTINNLAELYRATGSFAKAEPLYKQALAITEKALGPEHANTAAALNNLAEFYRFSGDYAKAEPLYHRALAIREKALGPNHPDTAASLSNLAGLYLATGAYNEAEPLYRRALAILEQALGPENPDLATTINDFAELYLVTGAYAKAEPLYQRALAIQEKTLGPTHRNTTIALNNLAAAYEFAGDYPKAETLFQRALSIAEKELGPKHFDTAGALSNLATVYQDERAYAKAEPLLQRALSIYEEVFGPEHPDTALSLDKLSQLYEAMGANVKAEPLLERSQGIDELNTARFLLSGDEARKRAYLQRRLGKVFSQVSFSLTMADSKAKALGLTGVLQYKGRVLDAMADSVALLRRSVDPNDRALFDELARVAQQLSTLTFRGPADFSADAYREQLNKLASDQDRLEGELSSRSATFRQAVTPIALQGVQELLPADAALVEFFRYRPFDPKPKNEQSRWGAPRYAAYVLRHEGEPAALDLGAAEEVDKLVSAFRAAISEPTGASFSEEAQKLFAKLIAPLEPSFSGIDRLLLSPDGPLNLLPFAALTDKQGTYVAKRFELTYLTSGRDLLALAEPALPRSAPLVMANPDYGDSNGAPPSDLSAYRSVELDRSGLVFKPLPGTADEAKELQVLLKLPAQDVLTGPDATEEKLKSLHGPGILHVATHGFFLSDQQATAAFLWPASVGAAMSTAPLGENPLLRSGIVLAGANARRSGDKDDGILTAAEAAQLDLRGTQLVVLSACETGLGEVQQGEGVYGLRRALVLAGAQAQLVSLWKVADAETQTLIVDYYGRLLKGVGRSAALREAQETMIANPATQHPYYWAAFVPIGNWTSLSPKSFASPDR